MHLLVALGVAVREARLAQGLSQEKLAETAQLHRNVVGLVERNVHSTNFDTLIAISKALGVKTSMLVTRAEELVEASMSESQDTDRP